MVEPLAALVVMRHRVGRAVASETLAHEGEALLKLLIQLGGVEVDVADLLPVLALVLAADDADGPPRPLAGEPQLARPGGPPRPRGGGGPRTARGPPAAARPRARAATGPTCR